MHTIDGVVIRGVVAAVPKTVARTEDYEVLTVDERSRFAKATGIRQRRIATDDQCASDLCAFATAALFDETGWSPSDVGLMALITQTGDFPVPATSIILQNKLGLPTDCICFDINLGCSAFPYGVAIVSSMMKSLSIRRGLLLIGDISSKVCAYTDKSAWPLFGDAGSATALELAVDGGKSYFHLMNDGSGKDAIIIPSGGLAARAPINAEQLIAQKIESGIVRSAVNLVLKGSDIFTFAIREVPGSIMAAMDFAKVDRSNVDFFVLHQANRLINETIRSKIGATKDSFLYTLEDFGNTSSVSIPLTLAVHGEKLAKGAAIVVSGFGVGLSWGSAVLSIPEDCRFSLVETDDVYPD
jgi:3-oxoacyl-[acyl-carrier-protein] synthase-3